MYILSQLYLGSGCFIHRLKQRRIQATKRSTISANSFPSSLGTLGKKIIIYNLPALLEFGFLHNNILQEKCETQDIKQRTAVDLGSN